MPDGIYFWNPTNPETIEPFYLTDRDAIRTLVYARPYRRFANKDEVTYFVANRDDIVDGKMGPIIVALKGVLGAKTLYDFTDDMKDYVATDISSCLGETSNGNILVSVKDKIQINIDCCVLKRQFGNNSSRPLKVGFYFM